MSDEIVTVKNSEGESFQVNKSEVDKFVAEGFAVESSDSAPEELASIRNKQNGDVIPVKLSELNDFLGTGDFELTEGQQVRDFVKDKQGLGDSFAVGIAQLADELAIGAPELYYDLTQSPLAIAKKEALKEAHPKSNVAGGVLGFVGSALAGGALLNAAGKVGGNALSKTLPKVAEFVAKVESNAIGKAVVTGVKGGAEATALMAPRTAVQYNYGPDGTVGEMMLGDFLLGGTFSAVAPVAMTGLKKANENLIIPPYLAVKNKFFRKGQVDADIPDALRKESSLAVEIPYKNTSIAEQDLKQNFKEIQKANDFFGFKTMPEEISASDKAREKAQNLKESHRFFAGDRAEVYNKKYNTIRNFILDIFGPSFENGNTKFQVGEKIKDFISKKANEETKILGEVFEKAKIDYEKIPFDKNAALREFQKLSQSKNLDVSGESKNLYKLYFNLIKNGKIKNLADYQEYKAKVGSAVNVGSDNNFRQFTTELQDALEAMEHLSIDSEIMRRMDAGKGLINKNLIGDFSEVTGVNETAKAFEKMKKARSEWAEMMTDFKDISNDLKLGKVRNARQFKEKIAEIKSEDLADRFLPKSDVERMNSLKARFPDLFDLVREYRKSEIINNAKQAGDNFNYKSLLDNVLLDKNMTKELREAMFTPQELEIMKNARTVVNNGPNIYNTSRTAHAADAMSVNDISLNNLFALSRNPITRLELRNVKRLQQKGIEAMQAKAAERKSMIDAFAESLSKFSTKIEKPAKTLGPQMLLRTGDKSLNDGKEKREDFKEFKNQLMKDKELLEGLGANLSKYEADPLALVDDFKDHFEALASAGVTQALDEIPLQASRSLKYLSNAIPKKPESGVFNLGSNWTPSSIELSKFSDKLQVAFDPSAVIYHLEKNTLSKDHVESLAANYPLLYQEFKDKALDVFAENSMKIPYSKKLKLSLLFGIDGDSSLQPKAVMNSQNAWKVGQKSDEEISLSRANKLDEASKRYETKTNRSLG